MVELKLNEVQAVSLGILKEIHSFCEENNITYSLIGGSLLGAVRHKGFIPWDDDIDIMMSRNEYERFCKQFHSQHLKLLYWQNDKTCRISYARVCDMEKTIVEGQAWTAEKVGIWIDVFPFDGAEDDYEKFKKRYSANKKVWNSLFLNRALGSGVKSGNGPKLNFAIKVLTALHLLWLNDIITRKKVKRIDRNARRIPYGTTGHISQFAFLEPGSKEYFDIKEFNDVIKLPFEGTFVYAIAGYNHYLSRFYGNYMELPPEEKRVPKQNYLSFIWRDN